ncbi:RuBisCO large subunit C-terminal-like domain-containing protein [Georgenia sp. H159]|uniref:RuBisCO large subunit C-terminal-like domain-containing protein n=1 Tax=Georgenia sp. H159 TaxID=3076115 RepID=UPI002D78F9D3|nr:RuBisCO large subunit C-terminal-like domain-containing protein [Georgenia sp. H159]
MNATDRLHVRYRVTGRDADEVAEAIRVEQTIEFPADLAAPWIQEEIVGRVEDRDTDSVVVSYAPGVLAGGLTQLLNVLWGNVSIFEGVRVVDVRLPDDDVLGLRGPRFGVAGMRELLAAPRRALLATALKPMGSSAAELAEVARTLAVAGLDIIKDDHSLGDQPWAPWRERVARCAEAVREANSRTGGRALYMPSLNVPAPEVQERAHEAKALGAGALLVLPGISGFDAMRALADDDELALPVMSHPSMLGSHIVSASQGIAHGLLLGLVNRLAGADLCVFPSHGGRFAFSPEQCAEIRDECAAPRGRLAPALPAPGGGMTVERLPELLDLYGRDVALLVGGALHRGDLATNAARMREAVESAA